MGSNKQIEIINNYLEEAYVGAKMMNDQESMLKINRAIATLNADVEEDIFTKDFNEKHYE